MNVWLANDNAISSIFPSYLLRAFQVTSKFTNDIRQASLIIGGRHITKIPENFQGSFLGVGLERPLMRTFPLVKVVNLLGRKTAEAILGTSWAPEMIMGDPLLLADFVWQRLGNHTGTTTAVTPSLLVVLKHEEDRKHILHLEEQANVEVMIGLHGCGSLIEFLGRVSVAKAMITNDPDAMAVAISFNIPCAAMTFASGDLFVWKDLFSVLGNQGREMAVKRMKPVTTVAEILKTWLKTQPFGELKVLKSNLLHQMEAFFQRKVSCAAKPTIVLRLPKLPTQKSSHSTTTTTTTTTTTPLLSQTQPIVPLPRLNPIWVTSSVMNSPPEPPPLPPLLLSLPEPPNSARSRITQRSSSTTTSKQSRSKSLLKKTRKNIISHATPKSL